MSKRLSAGSAEERLIQVDKFLNGYPNERANREIGSLFVVFVDGVIRSYGERAMAHVYGEKPESVQPLRGW